MIPPYIKSAIYSHTRVEEQPSSFGMRGVTTREQFPSVLLHAKALLTSMVQLNEQLCSPVFQSL